MCRPSSTATSVAAAITIEEVVNAEPSNYRSPARPRPRRHDPLVDREVLGRDNKRLKTRLRFAGLRQMASPEDVDYRAHRGLDRGLFQRLAQGEWIERQQNLLITGPTEAAT